MKHMILGAMLALLAPLAYGAENLVPTNAGFDDQEPIALTLSGGDSFQDNIVDVPGWRIFTVGPRSGDFKVIANASAPTAPNYFSLEATGSAEGTNVIHLFPDIAGFTAGKSFKVSFYARSSQNSMLYYKMAYFDAENKYLSAEHRTMAKLTDQWRKYEFVVTIPSTPAEIEVVEPQFMSPDASFQFDLDEVVIEEVTGQTVNILGYNWGFDAQDPAQITLPDGTTLSNSDAFPNWRAYVGEGHPTTFKVVAEPTAPSGPNVFDLDTTAGEGWQNSFNHGGITGLIPGNIYDLSFWSRSLTGANSWAWSFMFFYANGAGYDNNHLQIGHTIVPEWSRYDVHFKVPTTPEGVTTAELAFTMQEATTHLQFDSVRLENITKGNRVINGSFENSPTTWPGWLMAATPGFGITGQIIQDTHHGKQALSLSNSVIPEASDGRLQSGAGLPWAGGNDMYVAFDLRDNPDVQTSEQVFALVGAFGPGGDAEFLGNFGFNFYQATADWTRHSFEVTNLPENTAFVKVQLQFAAGPDNHAHIPGAVILDNFVVGDLTAGYTEPVEPVNPARSWQLFD